MTWQGAPESPPSVRMASLLPSLQKTEQRVIEAILADRAATVDATAQELADAVGVGRTTVIRAAQSLGYDGYPQLRVALAQELALEGSVSVVSDDEPSLTGSVRAATHDFAARLPTSMSALTEDALAAFLAVLDDAVRVLVISNGLSVPVGMDLMLRLNAAGRPAELLTDALAQQISARQLGDHSAAIVISGSGANRSTLDSMRAAKASGATVLLITSFAKSAATEHADVLLVVPPITEGFHEELIHTSRAALALLNEHLVNLFVAHRGERGRDARAAALSVLGSSLSD